VLIAEIEKYLGTSDHTKERHLSEFTTMPDWIKKDVKLGLMEITKTVNIHME